MIRPSGSDRAPAFIIREGSARVVAYRYGSGRFCLAWYPHAGARLARETKTGERAARDRAREIAIALANGRAEVLELTGADRETYFRIRAIAQAAAVPSSISSSKPPPRKSHRPP